MKVHASRFAGVYAALLAMMVALLMPAAAPASVVTLDLTINGDPDSTTVNVGDQVLLELWATVTDNTDPVLNADLGLVSLSTHIQTSNLNVARAAGASNWDGVFSPEVHHFGFRSIGSTTSATYPGGVANHFFGPSPFDDPQISAAAAVAIVERTLISSGWFDAVDLGSAVLSLREDNPANVAAYNESTGEYSGPSADSVIVANNVTVNVVPEPASALLLAAAAAPMLLRRRQRRAMHAADRGM